MNQIDIDVKKITFKRSAKCYGRIYFTSSQELRPWKIMYKGIIFGEIFNVSQHALCTDKSNSWKIMLIGNGYNKRNMIFVKKFDEDKLEEAKIYALSLIERIIKNESVDYNEMHERFYNAYVYKIKIKNEQSTLPKI